MATSRMAGVKIDAQQRTWVKKRHNLDGAMWKAKENLAEYMKNNESVRNRIAQYLADEDTGPELLNALALTGDPSLDMVKYVDV